MPRRLTLLMAAGVVAASLVGDTRMVPDAQAEPGLAGNAPTRSLSELEPRSDQREETIEKTPAAGPTAISALGRLEPKDGIFHVAGPSQANSVIAKLLVNKGDVVKEGQLIAVLDTLETR